MQQIDGRFVYAASDLNNYLECGQLTHLDRQVASGALSAPQRDDPTAELIARKGDEHERRYLAELDARYGGRVTVLQRPEHSVAGFEAAQMQTIAAMERGDALIYQATFFDGEFLGHPDFLRRVDVPSARWAWSYEVLDTKLALNPKPYFIIQLCNYSEHVARIQGSASEYAYIVLGSGEERRYRLADYIAYYRHLKDRFLQANGAQTYPNTCTHCKTCKWNDACTARREADDHLSLVAWMRRDQVERLNDAGIVSVVDLAAARDDQRPPAMNPDTFARLRRQAAMQVRGRTEGPLYDLIEHQPWAGFGLLPRPATGDVFFDMEGDPLYEPSRGLEYLFGCWLPDDPDPFKAFWALDRFAEKAAFEAFVDFIIDRRKAFPNMHVYHYADYERAALRRLAQAHGTREQEVDDLLRGEVFVDLFAVVRQAVVISESSYSIKRLERFYPLQRLTEVKKGDDSIVMFERWLDDRSNGEILRDIERYNRDDCRSTQLLRDWLLKRREEAIARWGVDIPFHQARLVCHDPRVDGCKECDNREKLEREAAQTTDLQRALLDGILAPQSEDEYGLLDDERRARYLLANLLAYHRREEKPVWWAFFDRCENPDKLVEFDKDALGGLVLDRSVEPFRLNPKDRNLVYTYRFPDQHYKLAAGDDVHDPATGKGAGKIVAIDDDGNSVAVKRSGSIDDAARTTALIPGGPLATREQKESLVRIASAYLCGSLAGPALDLILAGKPAFRDGRSVVQPREVTAESVTEAVTALDGSYLFVQGPPGSGKTTIGSRVICNLLRAGKRVGVLSTGHKAIHNLLHKVEECAHERGFSFTGLYKHSDGNGESKYVSKLADPFITSVPTNEPLEAHGYQLAGGTAWLFAREALSGAFDYLFIDEAGQVSLADAVAVSAAARNIVLLGDPSQLAQVSQGAHPLHAGGSVLEHVLGGDHTVAPDRGIFLDRSYRMHPAICDFISQNLYDGRLLADPETALQQVHSPGLYGSGLRYIPLQHEGNSRESRQEAERIADEIALLLRGTFTQHDGTARPLCEADIIVVTPYNAQRRLITRVLREAGIDVRVGTVDKFQGQEAAVVFYSMATSSGNDIPRDIDFLFERNRFNVAVSRARALAVVVASDRLADIRCKTIEQIATISLLCSFIQSAAAEPMAV
ncbi:MAG TPA: TM0106 family RecB-like putative nuclease [Candidatus Baltobacteraceae bacterium]|jgi:uncharacterized protein|nr:TM0106 family RecB-like putative nuclease [Candidatus Baltobacteraceae bacterium]